MAHVALITSEMAGRIQISCELGRRLEAAGHTVVVGCPAPIRDRVIASGIRYLDIEAPTPPDSPSSRKPGAAGRILGLFARLRTVRTTAHLQHARARLLGVDEFVTAMEKSRPDMVLIDLELGGHHLAAQSLGLTTAGWTSMLSVWKRPGLPPLGSAIVPGTGLSGTSLGIQWAWLTLRARRWFTDLRLRLTRVGEDRISVLRRVAHDFGVDFRGFADRWQWLVPFVPRRLPVLVFNTRRLELPHEALPWVHYVGPVIGPRPGQDLGLVADLVEARQTGKTEALIYASFGAWDKGDDTEFLHHLVEVARLRPSWEIIVGLGGRKNPSEFRDVPSNLHLLGWAPQTAILDHTDVAIHHAGISSVNECIRAGVPMVVYPFDFLDQPGNASRIQFHGLGVRGDRDADGPKEVVRHVEDVLAGYFRENVIRMAAEARELDEAGAAVATAAELLEANHQSPSAS